MLHFASGPSPSSKVSTFLRWSQKHDLLVRFRNIWKRQLRSVAEATTHPTGATERDSNLLAALSKSDSAELTKSPFTGAGVKRTFCCPKIKVFGEHADDDVYFNIFTARATTKTATSNETVSSSIIESLAHGLMADTSVGLNAVAVVNDRCR